MSLARLQTRLARLEAQAYQWIWYANDLAAMLEFLATAGAQAMLAPDILQALGTALRQAGEAVGQQCPARYRAGDAAQKTVGDCMVRTMRTTIDTQITDPQTRARLYREIQHVFEAAREAK